MNRFALLTLYRSLTRNKLYAALNVGGLAVGIAVFVVLGLYVRLETSFEKWLPHHNEIYLVQSEWHFGGPVDGLFPNTMGGLLEQLREDFPGIVGTRVQPEWMNVIRNGVGIQERGARVDPSFFDVLELPMTQGDGGAALKDPASVFIDQTIARKYFGSSNPVGQTMTVAVNGVTSTRRVAGVFQALPHATEFDFKMLVPLPVKADDDNWYHWGSSSLFTYLRFATPEKARAFEARMPNFADRRGKADLGPNAHKLVGIHVLPIAAAHLTPAGQEAASLRQSMMAMGIVGLVALLIAIVNYVNLATARAGLRAREVAMRKVLGANRATLTRQFIGEAVLLVSLAALTGLALAELGLPVVNAAAGQQLAIPYIFVVPVLVVLSLVVGVGAGFYPAILLSRFPAASVLASARSPGGGRAGARVREALVVFQFALAIAFVVGTIVLSAQTAHIRKADLGFKRDGLIVVRSLGETEPSQRQAMLASWRALPMVRSVTLGDDNVGSSGNITFNNVPIPGHPDDGPSLQQIMIGPDFFRTYGARLIAGRVFDDAHGADDISKRRNGVPVSIVINRSAVRALGFSSPQAALGKTVGKGDRPFTIIGVIDDMRFSSPRMPLSPTYYTYKRQLTDYATGTLRYTGDLRVAMDAVKHSWLQVAPQIPFDAASADERLNELYKADDNAARLFTIGAVLAVLIGCVGLWGLASFNTARRIKEIGIRKTLGASSLDIVKLLVLQFLRPVLIANLFAWPLAWLALRRWLAGFDDAIALSPLYFLAATALALLIAVLTVIAQSLRAARMAPAWALRHE